MVLFQESRSAALPFLLDVLLRLLRIVRSEVSCRLIVEYAIAMVPHVPSHVLELLDEFDRPPSSRPLHLLGLVVLVLLNFEVFVNPSQNHIEGPDVVLAQQSVAQVLTAGWGRERVLVHPGSDRVHDVLRDRWICLRLHQKFLHPVQGLGSCDSS